MLNILLKDSLLPVVVSFILSMICGFITIPQILKFCVHYNIYDIPNVRKVHHNNIPRLGGVAFLPSVIIAVLITLTIFDSFYQNKTLSINLWTCLFFLGLIVIYITGLIDDIVGLKANVKFLIQFIVVCFLPLCHLYINNLYGFLGIYNMAYWIGAIFTAFFLVYTINALNLIDGIDGLCSSLSLIALCGFGILFYRIKFYAYATIITGMMGVLIAYTYYNLFGDSNKHKKIFMGDSGSTTLGFLLGVLTVKYSMITPLFPVDLPNHLIMAMSLISVPLLDVARVIIVRLYHHEGIFNPDKNHIHHKLLRAGLSQHQALSVIIVLALCIIGTNILLMPMLNTTWIVGIDILLYWLFNVAVNYFINKRGAKVYMI